MKFGIREIVFIVLLTAIPVAAWAFVFRPNNARKADMAAQIKSRQTKLQALNKATATIGDLKTEIASLEKAISFFRSKLPNENKMDQVLQEVYRLAKANQLNTKSIRTLKPKKEIMVTDPSGPYGEQPISLELEGSFTGFYRFLLALERQPRIMRIQQMAMKKLLKAPEGHVRAECNVSVFFEHSGKE
jgi:Tfp pilus assembly protein PilO